MSVVDYVGSSGAIFQTFPRIVPRFGKLGPGKSGFRQELYGLAAHERSLNMSVSSHK